MLAAIKSAQKSIYWECYILLDNTPTHNFFDLLRQKARQGLKVKIIADALGSFWLSRETVAGLTAAGAEILFFNHLLSWWDWRRFRHWWFSRNHKKILIVDEKIGFIGGVNIDEKFRCWLDLHVRVTGLIVRALIRSFARSYRLCGGGDFLYKPKTKFVNRKIRFFDYRPLRKNPLLKKYYLDHLASARKKIIMATPYFAPSWWLLKSLINASRRGVKIEIILPDISDNLLADVANHFFAYLLSFFKIDFYFTSSMIHAKSLLVDDREGMVGSNNLDFQSFDYNAESSLVFRHRRMIKDLKKILEKWKGMDG